MAIRERLSGNEAVAYAIKQINPDVMPAFPITPSTEIPQYVANYIANGDIDTEFIHVDFKAIQAGGFDSPEEAWAAYQNQMP